MKVPSCPEFLYALKKKLSLIPEIMTIIVDKKPISKTLKVEVMVEQVFTYL